MPTGKSKTCRALPVLLALLAAACAAPQQKPDPGDVAVRVQERWDLLGARDFAAAYAYLSPGYRSSVSLNAYLAGVLASRVRWTGGRYLSSECSETACQVKVDIDYLVVSPVPGVPKYEGKQRGAAENWVKTDGQWWYLPDK